jgi:hypothetical protein
MPLLRRVLTDASRACRLDICVMIESWQKTWHGCSQLLDLSDDNLNAPEGLNFTYDRDDQ